VGDVDVLAYITGDLSEIGKSHIVVDVSGLGYNVHVPTSILAVLPGLGERIKLHVCLIIREDAHDLYGFLDTDSKFLFEKLIAVSGIGPKAAIAMLSTITPNDIVVAVAAGDEKLLMTVPGIGKKTAQRIILELKDKISVYIDNRTSIAVSHVNNSESSIEEEAIQALSALGYEVSEAYLAVRNINRTGLDSTSLVKSALKLLDRS